MYNILIKDNLINHFVKELINHFKLWSMPAMKHRAYDFVIRINPKHHVIRNLCNTLITKAHNSVI